MHGIRTLFGTTLPSVMGFRTERFASLKRRCAQRYLVLQAVFASIVSIALLSAVPAHAACPVPNTLTNGQVADASQVMADFNAVQNCVTAQAPAGSVDSIQYNADGTHLGAVPPLTDGQVIIGSTGNTPQAATLTAGTGIAITNSSGAITITATGGGGVLPTIRGSAIQTASSGSTLTINFPTGSVSGDLAVIFVGGSWQMASTPANWQLLDQQIGSYWNGSVIAKLLTAADITAGSVNITMASSGDWVASTITFQGNTSGIGGLTASRNSSGVASRALGTPTTVAGARYILFGSGATKSAVTISEGTQLQSISDGNNGSGALYQSTVHPFFGSANVNFASTPSGDYQAILAITGP